MKKWYMLGIVGVILVAISCVGLYKNYHYKYTQKDIDRMTDIFLEKKQPRKRDYKLYDLDKNKEITLYDFVLVCKEVNK